MSQSEPLMENSSISRLPEDPARDLNLIPFVLIGFGVLLFACVFAGNYGLFASRVPIVEKALTADQVNQKLHNAGIVRLSRGYDGMTDSASYLSIELRDGVALELPIDNWKLDIHEIENGRRYIIKPGVALKYSGVAPTPVENRDVFLSVIETDVSMAIDAVNQKRAIESAAAKSWQ